jgi:glycosyltransferase involved in cell wall biosynthesis
VKILIATPEYPPHAGGGIATYYSGLAAALVRHGASVHVVVSAPTSDDFASYEREGVHVTCVPRVAIERVSRELPQFSAAPMFRKWIAAARAAFDVALDIQPDAVEVTDFGLQFVPFVTDGFPAPIVVQGHGSIGQISLREPRRPDVDLDHALARLTEAVVLPHADEVMTYGPGNAREWRTRLSRTVTVEPPPLAPLSAGVEQREGMLVVGRIQSWKGPEVLCQALSKVRVADLATVGWVGRDTSSAPEGGSLDAHLRRAYPEIWGQRVDTMGPRSYAEVIHLMRRSRTVIVPSDWDVFNFTIVEAMSAGCVVVCSDGAGASNHIAHGRNGFVFPAGDARALASVLTHAASLTSDEASTIGLAARETVQREMDPDLVASRRLERFRTLAAHVLQRSVLPDWVRAFFQRHPSAQADLAFLDQVGLRDLSRYVGDRACKRVLSRVRPGDAARSSA